MARFAGNFGPSELAGLDQAVRAFVEREGPVHGLIDFSDVPAVELSAAAIIERGQKKPYSPGHKRVMVAPQPLLATLMRLFAIHQSLIGTDKPNVVQTMEAAVQFLGFG